MSALTFITEWVPLVMVRALDEIQEEWTSCPSNGKPEKSQIPLFVSTSQRGLLGEKSSKKSMLDMLKILPGRSGLMKLSSRGMLASPSAKFQLLAEEKDEISRQIPSSSTPGFREQFRASVGKKIEWNSLKKICRSWICDPMNMALLVWITFVAISGAILFSCYDWNAEPCLTKEVPKRYMV